MSPRIITRGSTEHRVWQVLGWLAIIAIAMYIAGPTADYLVLKWAQGVTFCIAILGLNLVTGYSGQISIGHSAFFGVGAYTTAILVADYGWPFLLTLPVAAVFGFTAGTLIGVPALKIRGLYLSLVTLGLALAFPSIVKMEQLAEMTGAGNGKTLGAGDAGAFAWTSPSWLPESFRGQNDWIFITCFVVAVILFVLASNLVRSRTGRAVQAMRDNEIGAAVSGVHPAWHKVMSFAFSAAVAAVGGGCFALSAGTIAPDTFGLNRSIEFIAGLVIGGAATILGPAIGGIVIEFLPYLSFEVLPGPEAGILYGIILVLLVFVMPGGVLAGVRVLRGRFVQVRPRLPDVVPPAALVAPDERDGVVSTAGHPDTQGGVA